MSAEKIGLDWTREEIVERFAKIIRNGRGPEFWQAPAPEWAVEAAETIWQNVEAIVRDRLETDRADIARMRVERDEAIAAFARDFAEKVRALPDTKCHRWHEHTDKAQGEYVGISRAATLALLDAGVPQEEPEIELPQGRSDGKAMLADDLPGSY